VLALVVADTVLVTWAADERPRGVSELRMIVKCHLLKAPSRTAYCVEDALGIEDLSSGTEVSWGVRLFRLLWYSESSEN
jgi:hypothetical protein